MVNYPYRYVLGCVCKPNHWRTRNARDFHTALSKAHLEFESSVCKVKKKKKNRSLCTHCISNKISLLCLYFLTVFVWKFVSNELKISVVAQPLLNVKLFKYQNSDFSLLPESIVLLSSPFNSLLLPKLTKINSLSSVSFMHLLLTRTLQDCIQVTLSSDLRSLYVFVPLHFYRIIL